MKHHARRGVNTVEYPRQSFETVKLDGHGVIRNDLPVGIYIPRDSGRRERLMKALGLMPAEPRGIHEQLALF